MAINQYGYDVRVVHGRRVFRDRDDADPVIPDRRGIKYRQQPRTFRLHGSSRRRTRISAQQGDMAVVAGHHFTCEGYELFTSTLIWTAKCVDCDAEYAITTAPRPFASKFYQRCEKCRAGKRGAPATDQGKKLQERALYLARQRGAA